MSMKYRGNLGIMLVHGGFDADLPGYREGLSRTLATVIL